MEQVYFDHAATTPPRPEVIAAMEPYLWERWGNPSSLHAAGVSALEGLERARLHTAALIGAEAEEIVFTGSGTEADNHALVGAWLARRDRGDHVITTAIEHHAIGHTADFLQEQGVRVTFLPVDGYGRVAAEHVREALTDRTFIVSIMHANNEIGTLHPIAEIGAVCRERGVLFHTDAVQTVGHLPLDVRAMSIDLLSLSAHKFYGPKGVGALFVRAGVKLASFIHGGGQESGRRASTENVVGIVGLGEAARLARLEMAQESAHTRTLRDTLLRGVPAGVPGAVITGHPTDRLPNNASFCFPDTDGHRLVLNLDEEGFAVSSGSACTSGSTAPSHVLTTCGLSPELARGSLRVSLGRSNTPEQVARFLVVLPEAVRRAKAGAA